MTALLVVAAAVGMALVVSPLARRVLGKVLAGPVVLAIAVWGDRQRPALRRSSPVPPTVLAPAQAWRCTLYVAGPDHNVILGRGVIIGPWRQPGAVETDVCRRFVARYGQPAGGELRCHAQPVPIGARVAA